MALAGFQKMSLFFQITALKEPCKDLRNAFPSTCFSSSIVQLYEEEWVMLLNSSLLHLPRVRTWTEPGL